MHKGDDASTHVERVQMQTSVDPVRDLSHTISSNNTNTVTEKPAHKPPVQPRRRSWAWVVWLLILGAAGFFGYRYWHAAQQKAAAAATQQAYRAAHLVTHVLAFSVVARYAIDA